MNEMFNQKNFDNLMDVYTKLDLDSQRAEIIKALKVLLSVNIQICETFNTNFNMMYNKEIGDLKNEPLSEKDFLEAVYAFIYLLKASTNQYVEEQTKEILKRTDIKTINN